MLVSRTHNVNENPVGVHVYRPLFLSYENFTVFQAHLQHTKTRITNEQFRLNFSAHRSNDIYDMFKFSARVDEVFIKCRISKNWDTLKAFLKKSPSYQHAISKEKHPLELKLWEYDTYHESMIRENFGRKLLVGDLIVISYHMLKIH